MARVELKPGAIERLTEDLVTEYHRVNGPKILLLLRFEAPIDTGQLRSSAELDRQIYRGRGQERIIRFRFPTPYTQFVFAGRGEVRPVNAKALRWVTRNGAVVFAMRSRAVPPNRWPFRVFVRLNMRQPEILRR